MASPMSVEPGPSTRIHLPDMLIRGDDKDLQKIPQDYRKCLLSVPAEAGERRLNRAAASDKAALLASNKINNRH